jgi:hypothetical protein
VEKEEKGFKVKSFGSLGEKINGVENVLHCVARKPFLSVELV